MPILRSKKPPPHAVLCHPFVGGVIQQFFPLFICRRTPSFTPVGCGSIILGQKDCQRVCETIVSKIWITTVFCQLVACTICIMVSLPKIGVLHLDFTPCKIISVFFWSVGAHIASCPKSTTRQPKVNPFVAIKCSCRCTFRVLPVQRHGANCPQYQCDE